jgi:hypothetical protein
LISGLQLPKQAVIAEVGVAFGDFSAVLIEALKPSLFAAFDIFEIHKNETVWGKPIDEYLLGMNHHDFYKSRLAEYSNRCRVEINVGDSSMHLQTYPDLHFDLIYIDGDHEFTGVKKDAEASIRKIKGGGILVFNDYIMMDHNFNSRYGVVPVVNDLCVNHGWEMIGFAFQREMFCDVAIRRRQ